ncbi:MAG: fasciclin domain-containing protein [Paludibacter sp.]|nr:fasciclin domain-containing protein [Paludibacter sp.]
MRRITYKWSAFLIGFLVAFSSCQSELEKYYQLPGWLKGNAWEVLEKKGNYTLFLQAVERTSYVDLIQGKGIITVMAPTDDAFQTYLSEHNYASVADVPQDEVNKLVGYHLVYYSFAKGDFEDYKPNGIESENTYPGIYYKFRTKSKDVISTMTDPAYNNAIRQVMHKERFLPVFSHNLFNSLEVNAKENYEYFYQNSTWSGADGFNVSNASVIDYAIVTDNGYVYTLDQVLEPLETVYTELSQSSDFSLFQKAYDRFQTFEYDEDASTEFGNGDSLYIQYHGDLPPIGSEWTNYIYTGAPADYTQLSYLSRRAFNVFAPDNAAMQSFFDKYWSQYYSSIDSVNFIPLLYFLYNHAVTGDILLPETIENGNVESTFGTQIQFNRDEAKVKKMCVNGVLYGLDHVLIPPMFEKVTAPMFCDPEYNIILDMMMYSSYMNTLMTDQMQFKVFYPNDYMIEKNTTLEGKMIQYINTNSKLYGAQELQIEGDDGMETMKTAQKKTFAGSHIATELISSRDNGNESVYRTINSFNYLYVKGNKVYSSALYNANDDNKTPTFTKIGSWSNGEAYALSGDVASALVPESNQFKNVLTSVACPADFNYFKEAVASSAMDKTSPPYSFLQGERFIVLIPKNDAIYAGWMDGTIPFSPAESVVSYLKRYFVNVNGSNLVDYPFAGAGVQGTLVTFAKKTNGETVTYTLIDEGTDLYIQDGKGNKVKILSYFPNIYADGAAYLIDGLLDVE